MTTVEMAVWAVADPFGWPDTQLEVGVAATGCVVGILVLLVLLETQNIAVEAVGVVSGVIFSGVALKFCSASLEASAKDLAWYPIGVLVGLLVWWILRLINAVIGKMTGAFQNQFAMALKLTKGLRL